ncbi:MAG: beta-ketoacyl synthase N-terminal-like domain-containing protein, partial [Acidimicrobiales bacterium]
FSVKPLTGHCQGAASAVEILATCYAFQTNNIPAPPQVAPGHPRLVNGLTPRRPGLMLKSSIGMGGYNSVVVLEEPAGLA